MARIYFNFWFVSAS